MKKLKLFLANLAIDPRYLDKVNECIFGHSLAVDRYKI
jgi:hypothetical protein